MGNILSFDGSAVAPIRDAEPAAVIVDDLVKDYTTSRALDGVTFRLPVGGTIGLVGSNGAGKTTTLYAILGLLTPSRGRVTVFGADMSRAPQATLQRMNFASPYMNMPSRLTLRQNLTVFGRLYGVDQLKARVAQLAWDFELGDVLDRAIGSLSAGQKARASLAKSLLNEPDLLLLDEPTMSLDPDRAAFVHRILETHRKTRGMSLIIASHNMREVEMLCDTVLIMRRGRVLASGTPRELTVQYSADDLYGAVSTAAQTAEGVAPWPSSA